MEEKYNFLAQYVPLRNCTMTSVNFLLVITILFTIILILYIDIKIIIVTNWSIDMSSIED